MQFYRNYFPLRFPILGKSSYVHCLTLTVPTEFNKLRYRISERSRLISLRVTQQTFTLQKSWCKSEARPILTQRVKQDIKNCWYYCVNARFTASLASCLRLRLCLRLLLCLLHKCEWGFTNILKLHSLH